MTGLLGPKGQPISSKDYSYENKKVSPPARGEQYGEWGGPNVSIMGLPGGGAIQFDLDRLTLLDYRQMTDHYQINNSLAILMFLIHGMEWRITCDDKKQQDFYTEQIDNLWTPLVRSMAQANWAGFSPNILQWDNDTEGRRIVITKLKDLLPEFCEVNWKKVKTPDGRPDIAVYDGIKPFFGKAIPVENTFWYPLMMQNGNFYGRKLLRSAFQPWFFSILMHLFANRYYERFGEPVPIGRAPYEDTIRMGNVEMRGNQAMELILSNLRSRSAVVLPDDRTPVGDESNPEFDYQIEYLESQMRGADFERYMTRLDEEMSLALFTPILLMRTADVGSYNLGDMHKVIYKWILNFVVSDWKYYIDWYLLRPLRDYNFGTNASLPKIRFKRGGSENEEMIRDIVRTLIARDRLKPDVDELAEMAGIKLSVVRQLTDPAEESDPAAQGSGGDPQGGDSSTENLHSVPAVLDRMSERVRAQVDNGFKRGKLHQVEFNVGYGRFLDDAFVANGVSDSHRVTKTFIDQAEQLLHNMAESGVFYDTETFMTSFRSSLDWRVEQILQERAA